jgi:hypothetical protein
MPALSRAGYPAACSSPKGDIGHGTGGPELGLRGRAAVAGEVGPPVVGMPQNASVVAATTRSRLFLVSATARLPARSGACPDGASSSALVTVPLVRSWAVLVSRVHVGRPPSMQRRDRATSSAAFTSWEPMLAAGPAPL